MKKTMCFLMALALVLGLTQCKKEKPQTQGVRITLDVDGGNSKVDVNPTGGGTYATVAFENGDIIYVGNNGSYCGYLQHNGTHFTGSIDAGSLSQGDYLHFYFMGNKGTTLQPSSVNITDQTSKYPVISYAHSTVKYTSGITHYSAKLQNYCAIVKFTTTDIDADITITGMKNTVTVDFAANNAATSTTGNPYSFSKDGDGNITLHRQSNTARWAILLPQDEVTTATATATGYASEGTFTVPVITANMYSNTGVNISMTAVWDGDLAHITSESTEAFATATDGMTITGTLGVNKKISIADGATVTLDNVSINYPSGPNYESGFAGITCLGDATIILKDGTTNNVAAMDYRYPGIQVGPTDKTLTIQGTGTLNAKFRKQGTYDISFGCGIGGGGDISCGNIVINDGTINAEAFNKAAGIGSGCCRTTSVSCGTITINGGTVTATGGAYAAGIGTGYAEGGNNSCGAISINGGTVTATGGLNAAGIGTGYSVSYKTNTCASITITDGVTQVTATKGSDAPNSIGAGESGSCGTVKFGDETMYNGSSWTTTPTDGGIYDGLRLAITTTTNTNDTWTLTPYVAPAAPTGAIDGLFSVSSTKQVYFSQGNLQYTKSTGVWSFMEHQYSTVETNGSPYCTDNYGNKDVVSLFSWATSGYNHGATSYQPYSTNPNNENYYAYGNASYNLYDQTGQADWGYNAISNGGNTENSGWRTLTTAEWQYLFANHTTGWSSVNGVNGYVIRPDGVSTAIAASYTASDWDTEEAAGAVFLPAAGYRNSYVGTYVYDKGSIGRYWSSSADGSYANYVNFSNSSLGPNYTMNRNYGLSVRLVKDAN